MKRAAYLFSLILFLAIGGCSSITKMNHDLEISTESIQENTQAVLKINQAIHQNTKVIEGSSAILLFGSLFLIVILVLMLFAARKILHKLSALVQKIQ